MFEDESMEERKRLINETANVVWECLKKRDYLTICDFGYGGSEADIEDAILRALMKGRLRCKLCVGWLSRNGFRPMNARGITSYFPLTTRLMLMLDDL